MDPQARILLEQAADALHQADASGGLPSMLSQCGVYIGCMYTEYLDNVLGPLVITRTVHEQMLHLPLLLASFAETFVHIRAQLSKVQGHHVRIASSAAYACNIALLTLAMQPA